MTAARLLRSGLLLFALQCAGCTVMSSEEAQALRDRQQGRFDAHAYVATIWPGRAQRDFLERAVSLADLRTRPLDIMGRTKGNRAGEGSPWTFVVRGEGIVRKVEQHRPQARAELETAHGPVILQIGPVISGSAIRDAIPSIVFDDFPDQIAFAEAGMMLTDRAMARARPVLVRLKPGDRVRFTGAASVADLDRPILVTPVDVAS